MYIGTECPCETCAFVNTESLTCWFGHDVKPERTQCTEWMPESSCMLCKRQKRYCCIPRDKYVSNDSPQCELFMPISNLKEFTR